MLATATFIVGFGVGLATVCIVMVIAIIVAATRSFL